MISTVEDLKLLSDDDLAGLVPLIGPRNRIKAAISQLNKSGDKSQQNGKFNTLLVYSLWLWLSFL